jgi:hypothetical protein
MAGRAHRGDPSIADVLALLDLEIAPEPEVVGYEKCRKAIQTMVSAVVAEEEPSSWLAQAVEFCNATLKE